jgi:hypothetical protein
VSKDTNKEVRLTDSHRQKLGIKKIDDSHTSTMEQRRIMLAYKDNKTAPRNAVEPPSSDSDLTEEEDGSRANIRQDNQNAPRIPDPTMPIPNTGSEAPKSD